MHLSQRQQGENRNLSYQILCKNMEDVHKMLTLVYPYLIGNKKPIAEMTLRFVESREFGKTRKLYSKEDWDLYENVKKTNQQGKQKSYVSSEALRLALTNLEQIKSGEDKVRTSMRVGEEILI